MATIHGGKRRRKLRRGARRRSRTVRIGAPDPSLTPAAGVEAVREMDRALGLTVSLDRAIGPIKQRARGLSSGQTVVGLASAMMAGEDHLVGLDRRRADRAGQLLEPAPSAASTTFHGLAMRFGPAQVARIEAGLGEAGRRAFSLLPATRRSALLKSVTLDGDGTDVQVYGRAKDGAQRAYTGALTIRCHIVSWAQTGVPLAADLPAGWRTRRPARSICWTGRWRSCRPGWARCCADGTPATSLRSWPSRASAGASASRSARSGTPR